MKVVAMSNTLIFFILVVLASFNPSCEYTLKLVHVDSPGSPYYNANDTLELRYKRWEELSERRYEQHLQNMGNEGEPIFQAPLLEYPRGLMLAEFGLGRPSSPQLAVIDTGSSFMWVVCEKSAYMPGNYIVVLNLRVAAVCTAGMMGVGMSHGQILVVALRTFVPFPSRTSPDSRFQVM
ncbi:hypothetical protein QQ045_031167 [Rhodiola kirilowii]